MQKIAKAIRMISLIAAAVFVCGLAAPAPALAAKAKDKQEAGIGYVNRQQVFAAYPGIEELMQQLQTLRQAAQKEYDEQSKDLPAEARQALNDKIARTEAQKEDALMQPVSDKIGAAIQAVAADKGLAAVIDAASVAYGGTDITADVIAKLKP
ncbi:OmpH family outer membrane protein [Sporomusa aerivorans]|uniref:OmpH family outer membrane protein n=1 Tax=Sporomusa aerivorans TaxID=204936 RepID=UPI00352A2E20